MYFNVWFSILSSEFSIIASKLTYLKFTVVILKICHNVQFCLQLIFKFFISNGLSDLIDEFYVFLRYFQNYSGPKRFVDNWPMFETSTKNLEEVISRQISNWWHPNKFIRKEVQSSLFFFWVSAWANQSLSCIQI